MSTIGKCSHCGAPLAPSALGGRCPKCLLQFALDPDAAEEADQERNPAQDSVSPSLSERTHQAKTGTIHYFGDYQLLQEIARGGMGVVWKARQVSLNRIVAVKLLLAGRFSSPEFVLRFRAEAEAAANLQHPNIVAIHEVGEHEAQHYFSMDFVDGQSLAERARENPLPPERAADYLKTIAEAVHYAHQRGILHRDLKPSNILIDTLDRPRLTDFGLAKRLHEESDLTLTGQVLGTPNYMSPEQAQGRRAAVTVASDVYSLGAILYFMLTGRPPFKADSVEATLEGVLRQEPAAPRSLKSEIPKDLETICLKCLSKEPGQRYGSAQALAEELDRFQRGDPITARRAGLPEKVWRWCMRKPALATLLLALLLVGVVGFVGIVWQWRRAEFNLHESYLAQAKALRSSSQSGRRADALAVLGKAAAIKPSLELRNEAIANLAQTDINVTNTHASTDQFGDNETFDPTFTLAAFQRTREEIELRKAFSHERLKIIRPPNGVPGAFRRFSPNLRYVAFDIGGTYETFVWDITQGTFIVSGWKAASLGDFSPDSRMFAIGSSNGTIAFLDLPTGHEVRRIGDGVPTQGICFDPSGTRLACWDSRRLEILDATSGARLSQLRAPIEAANPQEGSFRRAVWSGDGSLLAASGPDRQLYVWRTDRGQLIQTLLGPSSVVISVALSPSGELLAASSFDDTTLLCEVVTGRRLATLSGSVRNLAFSKDGRFLGPGRLGFTSNCIYEIVRPIGFRRLAPLVPETSVKTLHTVDFSPDGRLLAAAGADGVLLWDCATSRFLGMLPTPEACSATFDPDGSALVISAEGKLSRWPLRFQRDHRTETVLIGPQEEFGVGGSDWAFLAHGPRNRRLAAASSSRPVVILDFKDPPSFVQLRHVHTNGNHVALSPDGRFVATGTWGGKNVCISDARSGNLLHEHPTPRHAFVAFSSDSHWLVIGDTYREYRALPVGTWTNWQTVPSFKGIHSVGAMAFSPDGRLLAALRSHTSYELIEPSTWRTLAVLQSPFPLSLGQPRFSGDGTLFAAPDTGHGVQIWDLRQLRGALRSVGLDWDQPPYPPPVRVEEAPPKISRVVIK